MNIKTVLFKEHYGVVGILEGKKRGDTVAIRADMDALPVKEQTDLLFKSQEDGKMHACGHDFHMAILLGTAAVLAEKRDEIKGTVKFVFQPSEEASPKGGSRLILGEGILDDVKRIFGLHVWPQLKTGEIGIREGYFLASSDRFKITFHGKSAHAAQPHHGIDAIAMASSAVARLNTMMAREINPLDTAVLSIGTIKGGERYNVIPREAAIEGTVRTLGRAAREKVPQNLRRAMEGLAASFGGSADVEYIEGYAAVKNSPAETKMVIKAAEAVVGRENVQADISPSMIAEDFAYYQEKIDGAFFFLGCKGENDAGLHSSEINIDEAAIFVGIKIFLAIIEGA
jgi:amidohydrolase